MEKCLLSIDWDYFIYTRHPMGSYSENKKSLIDFWYKRYLQAKARGEDIQKAFQLSAELEEFWTKIKKYFTFADKIKTYVSDSHTLSYKIAKESKCQAVCLFDAHADLGYGGLPALNFEVNCSNWLGKLLKEKQIEEAYIFYSPYTTEKPEYFQPLNSIYKIRYCAFDDLEGKSYAAVAIHICRSGVWTPPWLDEKFYQFIAALGLPYEIVNCPERKWDPDHISLADKVNYLIAS
ncbi:MAG: arginase [Firmicutes bacterium]|nr:arginase [Bacillota bacterium]